MKFRKIALAIVPIIAMFFMYSCSNKGSSHKDPNVVAKIQKELINKSEVDEYYSGLENGFKSKFGDNYKNSDEFKSIYLDLVKQYVEQKSLVQLAKDEKLVDDSQIQEKVDKEFDNMKAVFGNEEAFSTAIINSRFKDEEDYKNKLKISLIIEELISKETENLKVSSSEIKRYYDENADKFMRAPGADVYHIFLKDEATATEVLGKLDAGEDFSDLAKIYSQDGSASVGGYLGYQEYDNSQLVEEFMNEVKEMEEKDVRGPVKTQFGYHIIKVDNVHKKEWTEDLDRVSKNIEETLKAEKINQVMDSLIKKANEKYKIKIYEDNVLGKKKE